MSTKQTRREFIGKGGAAAVGLGIAGAGLGARSEAFAAPLPGRVQGANERVRVGLIGCGGMGRHNLGSIMGQGAACTAICDVDSSHLAQTRAEVEKKQNSRPYECKDFRQLLERKDVDVVIIATPDHWHALPLIAACQAGKDVHLEKPISHNIVEGRAMVAAAKRHKRVVQVGTWQRSTPEFVTAVDYVRKGNLGRVTTVRAWKTDEFRIGKQQPKSPPSSLDYDFWVGPAEMVPYQENRCHFSWRWYWNFAAGMTGDWGVHMMNIGLLAMSADQDLVMPQEISATGGKLAWPDDDRCPEGRPRPTPTWRSSASRTSCCTGRRAGSRSRSSRTTARSSSARTAAAWWSGAAGWW